MGTDVSQLQYFVNFTDSTATVFNGNQLPTHLRWADSDGGKIRVNSYLADENGFNYSMAGPITSLRDIIPVPEPEPELVWLMLAGVGLLGVRRIDRKR